MRIDIHNHRSTVFFETGNFSNKLNEIIAISYFETHLSLLYKDNNRCMRG